MQGALPHMISDLALVNFCQAWSQACSLRMILQLISHWLQAILIQA